MRCFRGPTQGSVFALILSTPARQRTLLLYNRVGEGRLNAAITQLDLMWIWSLLSSLREIQSASSSTSFPVVHTNHKFMIEMENTKVNLLMSDTLTIVLNLLLIQFEQLLPLSMFSIVRHKTISLHWTSIHHTQNSAIWSFLALFSPAELLPGLMFVIYSCWGCRCQPSQCSVSAFFLLTIVVLLSYLLLIMNAGVACGRLQVSKL